MTPKTDKKPHPQHGSTSVKQSGSAEEHAANKHQPPTGVQNVEPEDPRLVGGSQPDQHRALEENVRGQAEHHPSSTGGLHATGSYAEDPAKAKAKSKK